MMATTNPPRQGAGADVASSALPSAPASRAWLAEALQEIRESNQRVLDGMAAEWLALGTATTDSERMKHD